MSHCRMICAASAAVTPSAARRASGAESVSQPSTGSAPLRARLRQMGSPITPRPMKPARWNWFIA